MGTMIPGSQERLHCHRYTLIYRILVQNENKKLKHAVTYLQTGNST